MCYYVITHDGVKNTYVIDVQLKPKSAPTCTWNLVAAANINRTVNAYTTATDDYSWTFGNTIHYHRNKYNTTVIFASIGQLTETYDFGAGAGYSSSNTYQYTAIGDYTAKHKVVNAYSLQSICEKPIRLKYNAPIACLSFNPDGINPTVSVGDSTTVTACISDENNRITNIKHSFVIKNRDNNSIIIRDTTIANNTNKTFSYEKEILELQDTFANQVITWNDGWDNFDITFSKEIIITNILPVVSISKTDLSAKQKRFIQTSSDIDGMIVEWNWYVYLLMPFSNEWVVVFNTSNDGSPLDIEFTASGRYKTEIFVKDDVNGMSSASIEYDIVSSGSCTGTSSVNNDVFFIFPDII